MPKVTSPLLSFGASGQIAKTVVYSTWKGIPYTRRYATPSNPRTIKQSANRDIWKMIGTAWQYAPAPITAAFNAFARGKPLTGRNKFFQSNQPIFATDPAATSNEGFIFSPGANGGLPPVSVTPTPAATSVSFAIDIPEPPTGWQLESSVAAMIKEANPALPFDGFFVANEDDVSPETNVVAGLTASTEYVYGVFLKWTKPDGSESFSISLGGTVTTTA